MVFQCNLSICVSVRTRINKSYSYFEMFSTYLYYGIYEYTEIVALVPRFRLIYFLHILLFDNPYNHNFYGKLTSAKL